MTFTAPWALTLLLALPYLIWLGRPTTPKRATRAWISLIVRCLLTLVLILALAGAQTVRAADELDVAYLIDVSDSVSPAQRQEAIDWVSRAIGALKPGDRASVVLFAAEALVERPLSSLAELEPVASVPRSLNTDIGAAIRLGLALLPAGAARRLVLLSDGIETIGDATASGRLAAASGVPIDVYPLGSGQPAAEVLVTHISAPSRLTQGDRFDLAVSVERRGPAASEPKSAVLRVLGDGVILYERTVSLARGENRFAVPLTAGEQGFARYQVQITAAGDTYYQNDQLAAFSQIAGPPRVLLVGAPQGGTTGTEGATPLSQESDPLAMALLAAGMAVDRTDAIHLPADLPSLNQYAAVVLVNVNAKHLSLRKLAVLQSYVRDLGGGLVVVGGPESYAPGGYYRTPLEESLPVQMQLKDQERRASLSMFFVIDKSGSMSDTSVGGVPKVELAKEAVIRSLGLLGPLDRAGVVTFDENAAWVFRPQEVIDPDALGDLVGSIRAGGGTDIYAGLLAVARTVPDDPATLKHVILLTDGGASEAGNPELVQQMHDEYGVTLSVVAIGEGYAPWIERLPELGEGRFHYAYDPATIPEIFTQETSLATRAYIIEEPFWPTLVRQHEMMSGIAATPPLYGYVGTSPKPAASTILTTQQDDPLLAAWRYGLGKSVAWTSDATGRWAAEWVTWDGFARFWEQVVKWAITEERGSTAETAVSLVGGRAVITAETASADGSFLDGLRMEARVVDPTGEPQTVMMQQTAPGRYQGEFRPAHEGAYMIRLAGNGSGQGVAQTAGWVLGYSPEYLLTEPDHAALTELAALTGGRVLVAPEESLSHDLPAEAARRPIWPWLATVAALLLPVDVALRRLAIGRQDWERFRRRVAGWWAAVARGRHRPAPRSEQVSRLMQAKLRAGRLRPESPVAEAIPSAPATADAPPRPERTESPAGPEPIPADQPESGGGTLAGRLLTYKQRRQSPQNQGD